MDGATGPIDVRGTRAGYVLRVRIRRIQVADEGYVGIEPTVGVPGDRIAPGILAWLATIL